MFDDPIGGLIGAMFVCEMHTTKFWAEKLKLDVEDMRAHFHEAYFNMDGVMGKENEYP